VLIIVTRLTFPSNRSVVHTRSPFANASPAIFGKYFALYSKQRIFLQTNASIHLHGSALWALPIVFLLLPFWRCCNHESTLDLLLPYCHQNIPMVQSQKLLRQFNTAGVRIHLQHLSLCPLAVSIVELVRCPHIRLRTGFRLDIAS
jgi:hypothetical protein